MYCRISRLLVDGMTYLRAILYVLDGKRDEKKNVPFETVETLCARANNRNNFKTRTTCFVMNNRRNYVVIHCSKIKQNNVYLTNLMSIILRLMYQCVLYYIII